MLHPRACICCRAALNLEKYVTEPFISPKTFYRQFWFLESIKTLHVLKTSSVGLLGDTLCHNRIITHSSHDHQSFTNTITCKNSKYKQIMSIIIIIIIIIFDPHFKALFH